MFHGRDQRIERRHNRRQIGLFRWIVRGRRDGVLVEVNLVRILYSVDERRILERRRIRIRIDQTTPPKRTEFRRVFQRIFIETQAEIEMRRIRSHIKHRIGRITNDIPRCRRIAFRIDERIAGQSSDDPTRVWRNERKRGGSCIDVSHRRQTG